MGSQQNLALLYAKVDLMEKSFEKFRNEVSNKLEIIERYFTYQHEASKKQSQQDQLYFNNFLATWMKFSSKRTSATAHLVNHGLDRDDGLNQQDRFQRTLQQQIQMTLSKGFGMGNQAFPATTILQQMLNTCNQPDFDDSAGETGDPLGQNFSSDQDDNRRNSLSNDSSDQGIGEIQDKVDRNQGQQGKVQLGHGFQNDESRDNEFEEESERIETEADPTSFFDNDNENDSYGDGPNDDETNGHGTDQVDIDLTQDDEADNSKDLPFDTSVVNGFHNFEATEFQFQGQQQHGTISIPNLTIQETSRQGNSAQSQQPLRPEWNGKLLCNICHSYFHRNSLRRHMRVVHFIVPKSKRLSLSVNTNRNRIVTSSIARVRANKYECDVCRPSVIFSTSTLLVEHVTSFHNTTPINCESCDLVFVVYQNFKHHQIMCGHGTKFTEQVDGKRRVKCLYCPRSYQTRADLVVHMRWHTGEKPFKCDVCGKSFSDVRNMKRHRLRCNTYNYDASVGFTSGPSTSRSPSTPIIINSQSLLTGQMNR